MSFILDALKKAERERVRTRVPGLTTVHLSVFESPRRVGVWVAAGLFLVGGGLSIWFLRPSPGPVPPARLDSQARPGAVPPASPGGAERTPASPQAVAAPPPASAGAGPIPSNAGPARGTPQEVRREPALNPPPIQAPLPQSTGGSLSGDGGTAKPLEQQPVESRSTGSEALQPARAEPKAAEPVPDLRPPVPLGTAPGPAEPLPGPRPEANSGADRTRGDALVPSPSSAPPGPPPLHDAIWNMKLDVFVYTDVEADRMVVINGRKYVVGQLVNGVYLLEGITREGAVLTYQGERLVLRP